MEDVSRYHASWCDEMGSATLYRSLAEVEADARLAQHLMMSSPRTSSAAPVADLLR
jgi:hypothetical protein